MRTWFPFSPKHESNRFVIYTFFQLGFEDAKARDMRVLERLWKWDKELRRNKGNSWPNIYSTIIGFFLARESEDAILWHSRLKYTVPSKLQITSLFEQIRNDGKGWRIFRLIYMDLPNHGLYASVVPHLCQTQKWKEALLWHRVCLDKGDAPADASMAQPLLNRLLQTNRHGLARLLEDEIRDAGKVVHTSLLASRRTASLLADIEDHFDGARPGKWSDNFCARLFATKMFSVGVIINYLELFQVDSIGPLSVREIGLRSMDGDRCAPNLVVTHLKRLEDVGISIGKSKFSIVVEKAAQNGDVNVLTDLITCDQHPDNFEDTNLQESFLASYGATGDLRQFNRTLAILAMDRHGIALEVFKQNLFLRMALAHGDRAGMLQIANHMWEHRLRMQKRTQQYLFEKLLSVRKAGRAPDPANLIQIINMWQTFMRSGTTIDPKDWVEILRRLGMAGMLHAYESLSIWLARWYLGLNPNAPRASPPMATANAIEALFPRSMQHAVLAWGFTRAFLHKRLPRVFHVKRLPRMFHVKHLPGLAPHGLRVARAPRLCADPALWGLRLLVKLRALGIPFDIADIRHACLTRLRIVFGASGMSRLRRNRRINRAARGFLVEYAWAMEQIWDDQLFVHAGLQGRWSAEAEGRLIGGSRRVGGRPRTPGLGVSEGNGGRGSKESGLGLEDAGSGEVGGARD
jgi:hypothetical protein